MFSSTRQPEARHGSVYVAVLGTAVIVSLIGLTSIHLSRLELKSATAQNERAYARQLAQSGVEMAMAAIDLDPNWRDNYNHGDENVRNPMGSTEDIIFRFLDNTDNNLGNDSTQEVEIQGIGRCGTAEYRYSVTYAQGATSESQSSQQLLKSFTGFNTNENVNSSVFLGQYFVPDLPAEATSWSIDRIDIYLEGHGAVSATMDFKLYSSDINGEPATLLEAQAIPESALPPNGSPAYHPFHLSTATGLTPGVGYCFVMEQTGGGNCAIVHYEGGATQTNSHLIRGGVGWWNADSNNSLQYRVYGTYISTGGTGPFVISPGSWQRVAVP